MQILHNSTPGRNNLKITLFGGEPLLFPELVRDVVTYGYKQTDGNIHFQLLTNGYNIGDNKDLIKELRTKYNTGIQISIDGNPAEKSDRTHRISLEKYKAQLNKAFDFLFQNKIRFNIRATLVPEYIPEYFKNYKYFIELLSSNSNHKPTVSIVPDFINSDWTKADFDNLDIQVEQIVLYIKNEYEKHSKLLYDSFLKRAFRILYNKEVLQKADNRSSLCGFANNLFAVSPDGNLYACHRVYDDQGMEIGNLLDCDIDFNKIEIIRSVFNNPEAVNPHPDLDIESCQECELRYACSMVCPADLYERADKSLTLHCNKVVYNFHTTYVKYVKKHLWAYMTNDDFKNQALQLIRKRDS